MKVLVAVDSSEASNKAVAFAAGLGRETTQVTLFHVIESLPEFIVQRSTVGGTYAGIAEEWAVANRTSGEALLAEQKKNLVSAGVPAAQVHTKLCQKESLPEAARVVAALAIIEEMKLGNYDIVVIGRRGSSARIESFLGGVAEKVAREAFGRTLCIVDR